MAETYGELMAKSNENEEMQIKEFWNRVFYLSERFIIAMEDRNRAIEHVASSIDNVANKLHQN